MGTFRVFLEDESVRTEWEFDDRELNSVIEWLDGVSERFVGQESLVKPKKKGRKPTIDTETNREVTEDTVTGSAGD